MEQKQNFTVIGKGKPIDDAQLKVTGRKQYVADMKLPQMLYGKILFSSVAHGKIKSIDTSEAENYPGVHAVATYLNTTDKTYNSAKRFIEQQVLCNEKIFSDTVRFVGDRIAAVAAESESIAEAVLKLIKVEYEPLPVITDIESAIKEDAYPIHPGGNIAARMEVKCGNVETAFENSDYVIEGKYTTPAIHHTAIEPHAVIADWDAQDKLTVYSCNQNCFAFRVILSDIFGLSYNKIRVVSPAIGGAFGGKLEVTIEPVAAVLSQMCGRPVKIVLTRKETMMATRVRHGSLNLVRTGFDKDGRIRAMEFTIYTNTGAYASSAMNVAGALTHKVFMAYKVPDMKITAIPVYTNTEISGAMRGYGSPQVYFGMQRQVNEIARILQKDPAEIQRLNMVDPDSLNPVSNTPLGNPRPKDCLEKALQLASYPEALQRQQESKKQNGRYVRGVGIALGVHGNNCFGAHRDNTSPMLRMNEDGSCLLYTGSHDMGTDTVGMQKQIISEILGITWDKIGVITSDTDACLWHIGDYSSRGTFVVGTAARLVAEKMKKELQKEAAGLLNASPEEISFGENLAWSEKEPEKKVSLREVMIYCQSVSHRELCIHETYEAVRGAGSYGVHIAEVEADKETGQVKILEYTAVHDVGFIINPLMIEAQLEGAIQMGLGYAISEEMTWDKTGKPFPLVLKKYGVLRADQMPPKINTGFIADKGGEPGGPYGAKALGECPIVPAGPAVVNAICNALDIDLRDLPATSARVLEALRKKEDFI